MSDPDGIISVMSESLANKIAAGEVVQRPASVLKELAENALDAGAHSVDVQLKAAGSDLVQVADDGAGMSDVDARRCFQRHATSKVRSMDDLSSIRTLGFRGEALASIAAVARVECKTRRAADDAGTLLRVEGGEITEERPCATPGGTTMSVRSLFYNVPARRNFLKTRATELKHLVETFQRLALSHPEIAFSLQSDGRAMHRLPAARSSDGHDGDIEQEALTTRIGDLFDEDYTDRLVAIDDAASYVSVRGVVGEPEFTRKGRGEQFLFVNDRYVQNRYLSHAVKAAYGDMLPKGAFPFFTLFLELDPRRVDVNVHPTKAEVKFEDKSGVYGLVKSAVKNALGRSHLTPQFDDGAGSEKSGPSSQRPRSFIPRNADSGSPPPRPASPSPPSRSGSGGASSSSPASSSPRSEPSSSSWAAPAGDLTDRLYRRDEADSSEEARTLFWQIGNRYILTDTPVGIMLVDPQAAYRRILYEQALDQLAQEAGSSQQLLFPVNVDLSPVDRELLDELLPELRALGFELEPLSGRSVAVRGLPDDVRVPEGEERALLEDVLHQYQEETEAPSVSERESLAKSVARRGALPGGTSLEPEAMQTLIERLFECEMPYADPEGRATTHKVSVEEIEKWFRTGRE